MSASRKWLKIVSFIQVVAAIAAVAIAFIAAAGTKSPDEDGLVPLIVMYIDKINYGILAVLVFFDAFTGIHGVNRPSALASHRLVAILIILWSILTGVISDLGEGLPLVTTLNAIIALVAIVLDTKVRNEVAAKQQ